MCAKIWLMGTNQPTNQREYENKNADGQIYQNVLYLDCWRSLSQQRSKWRWIDICLRSPKLDVGLTWAVSADSRILHFTQESRSFPVKIQYSLCWQLSAASQQRYCCIKSHRMTNNFCSFSLCALIIARFVLL